MDRRRLFKLAFLPLACLAWPTAWLSSPARADALFADIFGDASHAVRLGRLHHLSDSEAGIRGRALAVELADNRVSSRKDRLHARSQAEFAALDVVVVDGWVMARSEADFCAAVHLDRSLA